MEAVREFEEHAMASGHQSLVKEAAKYAEELNITLQLDTLNPVCVTTGNAMRSNVRLSWFIWVTLAPGGFKSVC